MEVYSIDEAFLVLDDKNPEKTANEIRNRIAKWLGVPVSVGLAPTKTLTKAANYFVKKTPSLNGVLDLNQYQDRMEKVLAKLPVSEIWGIGRKKTEKLESIGVHHADQFTKLSEAWVNKNLGGVTGLRTQRELKGIPCIPLDESPQPKKQIVSSRSFGNPIYSLSDLKQAVSVYTSRAAVKLRAQNSLTSVITVFISTNRFKDVPQHFESISATLPEASDSTPLLHQTALDLLAKVYREGFEYKKAGIILGGFISKEQFMPSLFSSNKNSKLMSTLDDLNRKWGNNSVFLASSGMKSIDVNWKMRRDNLSLAYVSCWNEILEV